MESTIASQRTTAARVARGASPPKTPHATATPLPPLKRANTGQMLPATAASPPASRNPVTPSGDPAPRTRRHEQDCHQSLRDIDDQHGRGDARAQRPQDVRDSGIAAPDRSRMSTPRSLAAMSPVGIEPMRYEMMTTRAVCTCPPSRLGPCVEAAALLRSCVRASASSSRRFGSVFRRNHTPCAAGLQDSVCTCCRRALMSFMKTTKVGGRSAICVAYRMLTRRPPAGGRCSAAAIIVSLTSAGRDAHRRLLVDLGGRRQHLRHALPRERGDHDDRRVSGERQLVGGVLDELPRRELSFSRRSHLLNAMIRPLPASSRTRRCARPGSRCARWRPRPGPPRRRARCP